MSSIRSILETLTAGVESCIDGNKVDIKQETIEIDQALKEISELISPKISDIDRLYTDEYDRKLWNEFKYEVQSNLKEALK